MTMDSTLEFEKRRNIPVKYDRELVASTVSAVSRIQEIKARRERAFFKNRMLASKPASIRTDALEVLSGSHLLGRNRDSDVVRKALAAAEIKSKKKERKRVQQLETQVEEMQQDLDEDQLKVPQEETTEMEEQREKIRIKVPASKKKSSLSSSRSALMPAGEGGMSMGMSMHID